MVRSGLRRDRGGEAGPDAPQADDDIRAGSKRRVEEGFRIDGVVGVAFGAIQLQLARTMVAPQRRLGRGGDADPVAARGLAAPAPGEGEREDAAELQRVAGRRADGWGYPMMMDAATPFQVMITPEEVLIVNAYGETRHIYTDGRPMPRFSSSLTSVASV